MGQPVAEMVGVAAGEKPCLCFQTAKGAGMDDAIPVALKVVAVRMRRLGMAASAGVFYAHRIVGEHGESLALRIPGSGPINIQPPAPPATVAALHRPWESRVRWRKPCASVRARLRRSGKSCGWRYRGHLYHAGEASRIAESPAPQDR